MASAQNSLVRVVRSKNSQSNFIHFVCCYHRNPIKSICFNQFNWFLFLAWIRYNFFLLLRIKKDVYEESEADLQSERNNNDLYRSTKSRSPEVYLSKGSKTDRKLSSGYIVWVVNFCFFFLSLKCTKQNVCFVVFFSHMQIFFYFHIIIVILSSLFCTSSWFIFIWFFFNVSFNLICPIFVNDL